MESSSSGILAQLDSLGELPTPPGVVAQLLELTRSSKATARDVADAVSGDPVMSAKILRFVNSPMAGINREVTSLQQAVALLGMNSVKMMALSFAVVSASSGVRCQGFDPQHFAAFSAACGTAARHLAEQLGVGAPSEAFTAGLLSQYGRFVFASARPKEYAEIIAQSKHIPRDLPEREREWLGSTYPAVGALLLRTWGLPESLCGVIVAFRDETPGPDASPVVPIVALAEEVAGVVCPATIGQQADPAPFFEKARSLFDLSRETCAEILTAVADQAKQMCTLLDVPSVRVRSAEEIGQQVRDRITELGVALHLENQSLSRQQEDLYRRATTDALTGIGNRAAFDARLSTEMERAVRSGTGFALLMLDVDHFKSLNDNHGHQAGDCVLKAVASALDQNVRKVDYVARYGGEEFALIAPDAAPDAVIHFADRLRRVVEACRVSWEGRALSVTISVGVAAYSRLSESMTAEDVIRSADKLLYAAKCSGRNTVRMMLNGSPVNLVSYSA